MVMAFLPGFAYKDLGPDGGVYDETGHPKACVHTTEGSSLAGAEAAYKNYPPHIGYDPRIRDRRQYVRLDRHSYAFKKDESDDEFVVQIEVVGFAAQTHAWPDQLYFNFAEDILVPLTQALGIPMVAPRFYGADEGIVLASQNSPIRFTDAQLRNFAGWFGHQHAPAPDVHWDPGRFRIATAFSRAAQILAPPQDLIPFAAEEETMYFARGDQGIPNVGQPVYAIFLTEKGLVRRYVKDTEGALLAKIRGGGFDPPIIPQGMLNAIPKVVGSVDWAGNIVEDPMA